MGISRGISHIQSRGHQHKGISTQLHAFAAGVMKVFIKPDNQYLITPLKTMRKILKKELPERHYQEGYNYPCSHIKIKGKYCYDKDYQFKLIDSIGNTVTTIGSEEAGSEHYWFFFNTQPSSLHPYIIVDLQTLAQHFTFDKIKELK